MHFVSIGIVFAKKLRIFFYQSAILLVMVACFQTSSAQSASYSFAPADSQYVMEVSRGKYEVTINITFSDSSVFDHVAIEKKADFTPDFSSCSYITFDDIKKKGRHVVKKDKYPYPASCDVQYRIKLTTADGATRTYPALSLPAIK